MIYLNDLNDDCLRIIIKKLNFRDQILLSQASQRFQYLIEDEWSCKGVVRTVFLSEYFWQSSKFEPYFPNFIRSAACMVEEIELSTYHLKRWAHLLQQLKFSKVKWCIAHLAYDDEILLIAKCFPQLIKLTLRGHFTGKHIWELKSLKDLHLDIYDVKLNKTHIGQLFKKLPLRKLTLFSEDRRTSCGFSKAIEPLHLCHTLEELQVAGDIVHTTISKIKNIKNLRTLTVGALLSFRFIPYPLEDIAAHFGPNVQSIIFNNVIRDRAEFLQGLNSLVNLRKIVFYQDSITLEQLRLISIQLRKSLEEFHYLKCGRNFEDSEKFLLLIANCSQLKVLDVSGTSVNSSLVGRISTLLAKQERTNTLILRCGNTNIHSSDVQNMRLPSNFELSFVQHTVEVPDEYFFQVTLK